MVKNIKISDEYKVNIRFFSKHSLKSLAIVTLFVLLFFALISGVSAKNFNSTSNINEIQDFLSDSTETDNKLVFDGGTYTGLSNLNVSRSINITSNGQVNIRDTGGTLFNITSRDVSIINLNISGYQTAIESNTGGLSVIGCNISARDVGINITGSSLNDILLENNTIISSVGNTAQGVSVNASSGSVSITLNRNNIVANGGNSSRGVSFHLPGCNNILTFTNNNISGIFQGLYLYTSTSNTTVTITNNNISGNYANFYMYGIYSNNIININNNNIAGTSWAGFYLDVSTSSNNTININNNNISGTKNNIKGMFGTVFGLYLDVCNSKNTVTINNNNIIGATYGVELSALRSNNTLLSFVGNNITGGKYAMCIYFLDNLSLLNNTFNSPDTGLYFYLNGVGAVLSNVLVSGNTILADSTGIMFDGFSNSVKVNVNYNRILASIGLNYTAVSGVDAGSSFDYNWWGVNSINNKIIGFVTNNHYILNITNLTSLDNLRVGDKVNFALLVLNTTLKNVGVENLPYFVIKGTFNGVSFSSSTDDLFVYQFTILRKGVQALDVSLDDEYVNFTFTASTNSTGSENDNTTNETNNNPIVDATMKKTGIPIVMLLILAILFFITYRRK